MELKFLGRGGAFNIFESNTSAYFIEDNNLFIIDVGETVFESLMKKNILDKVDNIYILITHTHSDHVGSLGSLILYTFYNKKYCANIVLPTNPKYLNEIISLLKIFGCKEDKYNFIYENNLDNKFLSFNNVRFKETTHSKDMNCYGILFDTNNGYIYYSGDTNELSNVEILIKENKLIDKIFIDTTTADYEGNVHLNINILKNKIPIELKNKVYCMHFNNEECIKKAKTLGFNTVEINK